MLSENYGILLKKVYSGRRNIVELKHDWENLTREATGSRVSDYYVGNICLKVFLKIAVPWILATSKVPYKNISKIGRKYLKYLRICAVAGF